MTTTDFSTTLLVDQSPKKVFDAVNNPRAWWSGEIEGHTNKLHEEFTYRYKDLHMSKQRIVEMVPGKKVVWLVTDSNINYAKDKSEWTGTKMIFEIAEQENKTELRFTHQGLVPEIACFDSCSKSWTQLVQEGLLSLINTGAGKNIVLG